MRRLPAMPRLIASAIGLFITITASHAQPKIQYIPPIPGGDRVLATSVSADGEFVVGYCRDSVGVTRAFRWRVGTATAEDLGIPEGALGSYALACNSEGSIVVGGCMFPEGDRSFRWSAAAGIEDLGAGPENPNPILLGVSDDGSTMIADNFLWTAESGFQPLATPPGASRPLARAITPDGSTIVGECTVYFKDPPPLLAVRAVAWSRDGSVRYLDPDDVSREFNSTAAAITDDAAWIFGQFEQEPAVQLTKPCRWNSDGDFESLGSNFDRYFVDGLKNDGSVAYYAERVDRTLVLWFENYGFRRLESYASALGLNTTGYALTQSLPRVARHMSADGSTIVGGGAGPNWIINDLAPNVAPPDPCFGDANGDNVVNFQDMTFVLNMWGADYSPNTGPGDANFDGVVDFNDITQVVATWNYTCFAPPVPIR